jgi:beta-lactamase class D
MRNIVAFGFLTAFLLAFGVAPARAVRDGAIRERPKWERHFRAANVEGSFLLYDLKRDAYEAWNVKRAETSYIPASTYKIFNSLVALETGVIKDENEVVKWDGVKREITEWNRDHTMRSAIKYSAVWFYQELARRVGVERMQRYIDLANYGNHDIRGGIDRFWLDGDLRITSRQQIETLVRLHRNELPFSRRSQEIVKDILINEKTDSYVLRAKTGLALGAASAESGVGWWVGYVERGDDVYFFATNINIVRVEDRSARINVTKNILREMKILE